MLDDVKLNTSCVNKKEKKLIKFLGHLVKFKTNI